MSNPLPSKISGTGVALVTPFKNGAVDYPALGRLIEHVIGGGIEFIVSLGTTGEAITLSSRECRDVLSFTIEQVAGRRPVVAGYFGGNYTEKIVAALKTYDFTGIAAIMSSGPAYSKPSQEGLYRHYMMLAEASPLPMIIYNVPSRTCCNIAAETTIRLARASDKFIAVKEASGDLVQAAKILKEAPDNFLVLSGEDPLALPLMGLGGHGVISVIANAYPRAFSDMIRAAWWNDWPTARRLHAALLDVHPWLYCEGNPVGIKGALEIAGHCSREVRIPQTPLTEKSLDRLKREMELVEEALKEINV